MKQYLHAKRLSFILCVTIFAAVSFLGALVIEHHNTISIENHDKHVVVKTLYGNFSIHEPVLIDLLQSPVMERIKHVNHYGIDQYAMPTRWLRPYTRYEHCMGVWALLRLKGAGLDEQVAGMLHDASHTVFSHVGDFWKRVINADSSYQDDIHEWYLVQQGVDTILKKHGMSLAAMAHKNGDYRMLEQNLPDVCADRLEYNLQGGLLAGMLTLKDVGDIVGDVVFDAGLWVFRSQAFARKLGDVSLYHTECAWGARESYILNEWAAEALDRAIALGVLTPDDIHFSHDDVVWSKLLAIDDLIIQSLVHSIQHYGEYATVVGNGMLHDRIVTSKFRGIDPWVKTDNGLKRLTQLDASYKQEYDRVATTVRIGWKIRIAKPVGGLALVTQ